MAISLQDFEPLPPNEGPPLPRILAQYLPFKGHWPWYAQGPTPPVIPPDPPPGFANLYGMVTDSKTGAPLGMAQIRIQDTERPWTAPQMTDTTPDGEYIFLNLLPSTYSVNVSHDLYSSVNGQVVLADGDNKVYSVKLSPVTANGFALKLKNAPSTLVVWNANFAENSFSYTPIADSGWISPTATWTFPADPRGCTTLKIWGIDSSNGVLFDVTGLGPIENGKNYVFDVSTRELAEG